MRPIDENQIFPAMLNALQFTKVPVVHVIPSGEVAQTVDDWVMAQKTLPFQAITFQFAETGRTLCVQVIPSVDVAAIDD